MVTSVALAVNGTADTLAIHSGLERATHFANTFAAPEPDGEPLQF